MGVSQLCTARELAQFLRQVLPGKDTQTLALVMCYGARCRDYKSANVNHQGMMSIDNLKTSFAYRLVYYLDQAGHHPTLTAVTGKIQHDHTSGRALIEREELIYVNMDLANARRKFTDDAKPHGGGAAFRKTTEGAAQSAHMQKLTQDRNKIRGELGGGDESNKYGKLVYQVRGSTLTVVNKYGSTSPGAVGPQTTIYSGPLVTPA